MPCTHEVRGSIPLLSTTCTLKTEQCETRNQIENDKTISNVKPEELRVFKSKRVTLQFEPRKNQKERFFIKEEFFNKKDQRVYSTLATH